MPRDHLQGLVQRHPHAQAASGRGGRHACGGGTVHDDVVVQGGGRRDDTEGHCETHASKGMAPPTLRGRL
jgi:hypothetical protein